MREGKPYLLEMDEDGQFYDALSFSNIDGLIFWLDWASKSFHALNLAPPYDRDRIYFIMQSNYKAMKIGISNNPEKRLVSLQTGNPHKLLLLFHYDPIEYKKQFAMYPMFKSCIHERIEEHEKHEIQWYGKSHSRIGSDNSMNGEWVNVDGRTFRILIRQIFYWIYWHKHKEA